MTTSNPARLHSGVHVARRKNIGKLLRPIFGVERLRDGQQQVIDSVLDGRDTQAIMLTGSGKSLCYQIPARLLDGTTIVVLPRAIAFPDGGTRTFLADFVTLA